MTTYTCNNCHHPFNEAKTIYGNTDQVDVCPNCGSDNYEDTLVKMCSSYSLSLIEKLRTENAIEYPPVKGILETIREAERNPKYYKPLTDEELKKALDNLSPFTGPGHYGC